MTWAEPPATYGNHPSAHAGFFNLCDQGCRQVPVGNAASDTISGAGDFKKPSGAPHGIALGHHAEDEFGAIAMVRRTDAAHRMVFLRGFPDEGFVRSAVRQGSNPLIELSSTRKRFRKSPLANRGPDLEFASAGRGNALKSQVAVSNIRVRTPGRVKPLRYVDLLCLKKNTGPRELTRGAGVECFGDVGLAHQPGGVAPKPYRSSPDWLQGTRGARTPGRRFGPARTPCSDRLGVRPSARAIRFTTSSWSSIDNSA